MPLKGWLTAKRRRKSKWSSPFTRWSYFIIILIIIFGMDTKVQQGGLWKKEWKRQITFLDQNESSLTCESREDLQAQVTSTSSLSLGAHVHISNPAIWLPAQRCLVGMKAYCFSGLLIWLSESWLNLGKESFSITTDQHCSF